MLMRMQRMRRGPFTFIVMIISAHMLSGVMLLLVLLAASSSPRS